MMRLLFFGLAHTTVMSVVVSLETLFHLRQYFHHIGLVLILRFGVFLVVALGAIHKRRSQNFGIFYTPSPCPLLPNSRFPFSYGHTSTQCPCHEIPVSVVSTAGTHTTTILRSSYRSNRLFSSTLTYHSTDLLATSGMAHLVVHGTSGLTSYETISPVRLETSGGVPSTVDMVVQRLDCPPPTMMTIQASLH